MAVLLPIDVLTLCPSVCFHGKSKGVLAVSLCTHIRGMACHPMSGHRRINEHDAAYVPAYFETIERILLLDMQSSRQEPGLALGFVSQSWGAGEVFQKASGVRDSRPTTTPSYFVSIVLIDSVGQ